jgi:hypothetical protein
MSAQVRELAVGPSELADFESTGAATTLTQARPSNLTCAGNCLESSESRIARNFASWATKLTADKQLRSSTGIEHVL